MSNGDYPRRLALRCTAALVALAATATLSHRAYARETSPGTCRDDPNYACAASGNPNGIAHRYCDARGGGGCSTCCPGAKEDVCTSQGSSIIGYQDYDCKAPS